MYANPLYIHIIIRIVPEIYIGKLHLWLFKLGKKPSLYKVGISKLKRGFNSPQVTGTVKIWQSIHIHTCTTIDNSFQVAAHLD